MTSTTASRRPLPIIVMTVAVVALLAVPTIVRTFLGIGITTVLTGSMRPAIDPGDLVVTRLSSASTITTGDVVVFDNGGTPYAHRVVEVRPLNGLQRLTTKGDANTVIDTDPVMASPNQQVPRVVWRVPAVGSTLAYLTSPDSQRLALTLLIGANLMALALFALRRRPDGAIDEAERSPEATHPALADTSSVDA